MTDDEFNHYLKHKTIREVAGALIADPRVELRDGAVVFVHGERAIGLAPTFPKRWLSNIARQLVLISDELERREFGP